MWPRRSRRTVVSNVHLVGYDRDGDAVWSIGIGIVIGGPSMDAVEADCYATYLKQGLKVGYRLADYARKFGPISKDRS